MSFEFTCCECGRAITRIGGGVADFAGGAVLCGSCTFLPGWFREPSLREAIDREHDGREVCERGEPPPPPSWEKSR